MFLSLILVFKILVGVYHQASKQSYSVVYTHCLGFAQAGECVYTTLQNNCIQILRWCSSMNVHRLFITNSVHHAVKIFVSQTYLFYKNDSHTKRNPDVCWPVGKPSCVSMICTPGSPGSRQGLLETLISMGIRFVQGVQGVQGVLKKEIIEYKKKLIKSFLLFFFQHLPGVPEVPKRLLRAW